MSTIPPDAPVPAPDQDLSIDPGWATRILTEFISREVLRTGLQKVVVGLSGGVDSAVSTYLAVRALGPSAVICLLMPYRTSSEASVSDAREVVDALGVRSETLDITRLVDGFQGVAGEVTPLRLGNVMARARMALLFDRSAEHEALVLGTSNKSELLLGYGTLHGDLACALNPIGDLYKTQVYALAEHLGVPEPIRTKPPSADLWPGQSDESELGFSYAEVDRLLALLVEGRLSQEAAIDAGFTPELVDRVTGMIMRSQFKRQPPVIAKISRGSVAWDFRYPQDWSR